MLPFDRKNSRSRIISQLIKQRIDSDSFNVGANDKRAVESNR